MESDALSREAVVHSPPFSFSASGDFWIARVMFQCHQCRIGGHSQFRHVSLSLSLGLRWGRKPETGDGERESGESVSPPTSCIPKVSITKKVTSLSQGARIPPHFFFPSDTARPTQGGGRAGPGERFRPVVQLVRVQVWGKSGSNN